MLLTSRLLRDAGVAHGFSLRAGGVSEGPFASLNTSLAVGDDPRAVEENLARLGKAAGVGRIATAAQVHGDRVLLSEAGALRELFAESQPGAALAANLPGEPADAIAALERGAAVGVRMADCVPVLLHDPASGAVAAVHAGWRGSRLAIAGRGVRALAELAGRAGHPFDARHVVAAVGPCIGRCCYEVSRELAAAFRALFGAGVADDPAAVEKPHLDLRACQERALEAAGVRAENVEQVGGCTSCEPALYFSHRRDQGRTGRHLAFAAAGRQR